MTTNDECGCKFRPEIPALTAVCGEHALGVTHTGREGYTAECQECEGTGGVCEVCDGSTRMMVTLEAGRHALRWADEYRAWQKSQTPIGRVLGSAVFRNPRNRPKPPAGLV